MQPFITNERGRKCAFCSYSASDPSAFSQVRNFSISINLFRRRSQQSTASKRSSWGQCATWGSSIFSLLPDELILYILAFCDARDVVILTQVCHQWRRLANDEFCWRRLLIQRWPLAQPLIGFKHCYMRKHHVEHKWWTGKCRMRPLQGHQAPVSCVKFHGDVMISSSFDSTLKIWYMQSELCVHTVRGHSRAVWALQYDDSHIVSAGDDRVVKVFDIYSGNCIRTFAGHGNWVHTVQFEDWMVVSGSGDATAIVWDKRTALPSMQLREHRYHQRYVM